MRNFCSFGTSRSNGMCFKPVFHDSIVKAQSVMAEASCSKKVAEKSVFVDFSSNIDSDSEEKNTLNIIGNEEYDFYLADDIYSDFE